MTRVYTESQGSVTERNFVAVVHHLSLLVAIESALSDANLKP